MEGTADVDCTATSEATATTIITAPALTFDGSTVVLIQFGMTAFGDALLTVTNNLVLYDNGGSVGALAAGRAWSSEPSGHANGGRLFTRRLTPTAGQHTYSVRGYVSSAATFIIAGSTGVGQLDRPHYLRVFQVAQEG